jgi:hypothetical protein
VEAETDIAARLQGAHPGRDRAAGTSRDTFARMAQTYDRLASRLEAVVAARLS